MSLLFLYITITGEFYKPLGLVVMNKYKSNIILILFFTVLSTCLSKTLVQAESLSTEELVTEHTQQSSEEQVSTTENSEMVIENQTYEESWAVVSTVSELQTALKNKEPYIKLADSTEVFDFGNTAIPITGNVTIDGNNRQISYNGGNLNSNKGLYTTTGGLTIKLQNVTFGSEDYTVPAVGLYGIMQSEAATQLHIENVNYYSNQSAQPFYLRNINSKIYFHGTNQFMQQNVDGSTATGQEFAECNNYEFAVGSHTTIVQNTNDALGSLWMPGSSSSITVGEGAEVDITSNHHFIYADGTNNSVITLAKNSKFSVMGTNSAKGYFYYFDKPAFITVGEGAEFSVNYPRYMRLAAGSALKFLPDSVGDFEVSQDESVFDRAVGANSAFEIDNAKRIRFKAKTGTAYNPIGFTNASSKFIFSAFGEDTNGYEVVTNEPASSLKLTPQLDAGTWSVATSTISRSAGPNTPDFTADEKTALKNAESITLNRLNPPVELLAVNQEIDTHDASFQLADYQLHGNDDLIKSIDFKLYDKKTDDPSAEGDGFIEQQQTSNLDQQVTFSNLKDRTEYFLYVRIVCDPDSQSSEWLEVPFKTEQEMINVSFPVEVAFYSDKSDDQQKVHEAGDYSIDNHSSFPVAVQATDFQELSNPGGIQLLPSADENNKKDILLKLTEAGQPIGVLSKNLSDAPLSFKDLAGNSSTKLGFSGIYYGNEKTAQKIQYRLTMTAERKD